MLIMFISCKSDSDSREKLTSIKSIISPHGSHYIIELQCDNLTVASDAFLSKEVITDDSSSLNLIYDQLHRKQLATNKLYDYPARSYHILSYSDGETKILCLGGSFGGKINDDLIELDVSRKLITLLDSITNRTNYHSEIDIDEGVLDYYNYDSN